MSQLIPTYLVDEHGNPITSLNPLPTSGGGGGGTVDQGEANADATKGWSARLTDGSAFIVPAKTGQLPSALGATTAAGSLAVGIATDQLSLLATAALQTTGNSSLSSILGQLDAKTSTLATETTLSAAKTLLGAGLPATLVGGRLDVNIGAGTVTVTPSGTQSVTGTGTAGTPATGVLTVQGIASMTALKVDGSAVTQPISAASLPLPTGAATEATLSLLTLAQNSTTGGQSGPLMMGAVTTNAPSYLNNRTQPFSLDTSGGLRVAGYNTPSTAQANPTNAVPTQAFLMVWNGSTWDRLLSEGITGDGDNAPSAGTVSAEAYNMGFNGATWDRVRVGGDNSTNPTIGKQYVLSARANAAAPSWTEGNAVPLSTDLAGGLRIGVTQGSTTSGQTGPLMQAAVQSAAPSLTDGQTRPLSLTLAGALRVDGSSASQPVIGTAANGVAPANNPVLVAGYDGTLTRTLKTDTGGQQIVVGAGTAGSASGGVLSVQGVASGTNLNVAQATASALNATVVQATASSLNAQVFGGAANAAAVSGNPVLTAGYDGTNARTLRTDSAGAPYMAGGSSYNTNGANETRTVRTGAGVLIRLVINPGTSSTFIVYDNTAGSGTVLAALTTGSAGGNGYSVEVGAVFSTGLTYVSTGGCNVTLVYRAF